MLSPASVGSGAGLLDQASSVDPLRGRLAYSVRETAAALGVSEKTIRRLIDRGLLRVSRSLRHILIPRAEIDRFLRSTLDVGR
ncbi:MAG: helix-turn-helix domain-containing protein [Verrucomicrobiae bacterium]|nr:helix-turn-helix domain-containing protein [Verrucomicrobiae bacterium]